MEASLLLILPHVLRDVFNLQDYDFIQSGKDFSLSYFELLLLFDLSSFSETSIISMLDHHSLPYISSGFHIYLFSLSINSEIFSSLPSITLI